MKNSNSITNEDFIEIYNRNVKRIYQLCMLYLKNHSDAEDIVQIVFIKYLKSSKIFESIEHEKAWFIKVTKNCCKDVLRCWWKSNRVDIEKIPELYDCEDSHVELLTEELLALPNKYKEILYLYYFEGYSVKDISKFLYRNESTIRTQLAKGREILKINLGGFYEKKTY